MKNIFSLGKPWNCVSSQLSTLYAPSSFTTSLMFSSIFPGLSIYYVPGTILDALYRNWFLLPQFWHGCWHNTQLTKVDTCSRLHKWKSMMVPGLKPRPCVGMLHYELLPINLFTFVSQQLSLFMIYIRNTINYGKIIYIHV